MTVKGVLGGGGGDCSGSLVVYGGGLVGPSAPIAHTSCDCTRGRGGGGEGSQPSSQPTSVHACLGENVAVVSNPLVFVFFAFFLGEREGGGGGEGVAKGVD